MPGTSADVAVDYTPSDVGDDAGTLEIVSNDPDTPSVSVALSGTGTPVSTVCDIDVAPLAFGSLWAAALLTFGLHYWRRGRAASINDSGAARTTT